MLGLRDDKKLFDSCGYLACKRIIKNVKTGETKTLFYIFIKGEFKFTDYEMVKLAHECLHICQFSLPDILDRDKENEAEAYLHSHLMHQILKLLRCQ